MAPTTRSQTRVTNQPLLQLTRPARVQGPKVYHCIVCLKAFRSKGWVRRHYRTHRGLPFKAEGGEIMPSFTHPSCWPAEENSWARINAIQAKKEANMDARPVDMSATAAAEWDARFEMVDVAALDLDELADGEQRKRLSMWLWWWNANGDDYRNHMDNGDLGMNNIAGNAGFLDLRIQGLEERRNVMMQRGRLIPLNVAIRQNSPAPSVTQRSTEHDPSDAGYQALQSIPFTSHLWPYPGRTAQGPNPGAFELVQNYLEDGALNITGVMHFLSDVNIRYTENEGENFDASAMLGMAVCDFVNGVATTRDIKDACEAFNYNLTASDLEGDAARREDAARFRTNREKFWGFLRQATGSWFDLRGTARHPDKDLMKCLSRYAGQLKDKQGIEQTRACLEKDRTQVEKVMEEYDDWRMSPRWRHHFGIVDTTSQEDGL